MKKLLVGLDIGTSCVKAGLFDTGGHMLASAREPIGVMLPNPGWVEQEPEDWWKAACKVLRRVTKAAQGGQIAAVGLAGQCPGHVLVDQSGRAIGRAIIWQDQRAQAEASWLNERIQPAKRHQSIGTSAPFDANSPLARLIWVKNHRPDDWASTACVLQPKDYIALRLSGQTATDRFSAYCLARPDSGGYETEFFLDLGIEPEKLPKTYFPTEVVGTVTREGLRGASLVTGTIDAYCDTLAGGIACPGRAVDVAGTSEIISLRIETPVTVDGIFMGQIGDGVSFLCGPTQAGGETIRWLAHAFYPESHGKLDFSKLEREAGSAPAGCEGLVFLPYLNGERTPIWDAQARGCFYGLTLAHRRGHFTRAAYEGVGFAIRHILELAEQGCGCEAERIVVCGGASRSRFWNQVKADILQRPVQAAEIAETGCLGAAILASIGINEYPDLRTASEAMVRLGEEVLPDYSLSTVYDDGYGVYRQLYPELKPLFKIGAE